MESEKGSFSAICRLLHSVADQNVADGLARVEKDWADNLSGRRLVQFRTEHGTYSPRMVFDTWLYAQTFHQDAKRQGAVAELREFEPMGSVTLQVLVRQLAIAILNLDAVLRYALGLGQRDLKMAPESGISTGLFRPAV